MSCRVIGRTLETAILAIITQKLENRGVATLIGHFVPTEKNGPAKNFLAEHGFKEGRDKSFAIKLPDLSLKVPSWVSI